MEAIVSQDTETAREFVRDHKREVAFGAGYGDFAAGDREREHLFAGTAEAVDYEAGRAHAAADQVSTVVDLYVGRHRLLVSA